MKSGGASERTIIDFCAVQGGENRFVENLCNNKCSVSLTPGGKGTVIVDPALQNDVVVEYERSRRRGLGWLLGWVSSERKPTLHVFRLVKFHVISGVGGFIMQLYIPLFQNAVIFAILMCCYFAVGVEIRTAKVLFLCPAIFLT